LRFQKSRGNFHGFLFFTFTFCTCFAGLKLNFVLDGISLTARGFRQLIIAVRYDVAQCHQFTGPGMVFFSAAIVLSFPAVFSNAMAAAGRLDRADRPWRLFLDWMVSPKTVMSIKRRLGKWIFPHLPSDQRKTRMDLLLIVGGIGGGFALLLAFFLWMYGK